MGRAPAGRLKDAVAAGLHTQRIWRTRATRTGYAVELDSIVLTPVE
jgi:hypothetical protein